MTARIEPSWIIIGEHAARIVEAEQPLADQQVRRRRDRQELGEPLHDAEQRGLNDVDMERSDVRRR